MQTHICLISCADPGRILPAQGWESQNITHEERSCKIRIFAFFQPFKLLSLGLI